MKLLQRLATLPLRLRITLGIFVCAIVFVMLVVIAISQFNQVVPSAMTSVLSQYATERANLINLAIQKGQTLTLQIASDPSNQETFVSFNALPDKAPLRASLQTTFQQILNIEPSVRQIRFVSSSGNTLVSLPTASEDTNETDETYFRTFTEDVKGLSNTSVYVSEISSENPPAITYAAPTFSSTRDLSGFIVVSQDISGSADPKELSIYRAMQKAETSLGIVDFYLLSNDNRVIHTHKDVTAVSAQSVTDSQLLTRADGNPYQYVSLWTNQPAIGISQKIGTSPLVLVTELPASQISAVADLSRFVWPMVTVGLVGLLIIAIVAVALDWTIARPMQSVLDVTKGLAYGHQPTTTDIFSQQDELGQMREALLEIGDHLQENNLNLAARITERVSNLAAIRNVSVSMLSARSVNGLYADVASLIQKNFNFVENVQFFGVDANHVSAVIHFTTDKAYGRARSANQWPVNVQNLIGRVVIGKSAEILLETDTTDTGDTLMPGMRSELSIPLIENNIVIGVLDLQSTNLTAFSQAEVLIFSDIVELFVIALKTARQTEQLEAQLGEATALNEQLLGETWRKYVGTRPATMLSSKAITENWSETQRRAVAINGLAENVGPNTVTFAVPVSLRNQILGAVEWEVPRTAYNEGTRQLAQELATRLAISADNARLFEQSQWTAQRERLVNEISSKLTQQTDVAEILKIAVREVGQALRLPQTSIRLATNEDTKQG
jgi:GAF domain-containing protein